MLHPREIRSKCKYIDLNYPYKTIDVVECQVEKGVLGKVFKKDAKQITEYLTKLSTEEVEALEKLLQEKG